MLPQANWVYWNDYSASGKKKNFFFFKYKMLETRGNYFQKAQITYPKQYTDICLQDSHVSSLCTTSMPSRTFWRHFSFKETSCSRIIVRNWEISNLCYKHHINIFLFFYSAIKQRKSTTRRFIYSLSLYQCTVCL